MPRKVVPLKICETPGCGAHVLSKAAKSRWCPTCLATRKSERGWSTEMYKSKGVNEEFHARFRREGTKSRLLEKAQKAGHRGIGPFLEELAWK